MPEGRQVSLICHPYREAAQAVATQMRSALASHDIAVIQLGEPGEPVAPRSELLVVLGGDGTILRAAGTARAAGVPLLGVNLGHVGFLAEAEVADIDSLCAAIVARSWAVEQRAVLSVQISRPSGERLAEWALNEVAVERTTPGRMLDLRVVIDGRPLSRWHADGLVVATPTGSTAYAFSAGGPIVWPQVAAMLVVPLAAHALFSRPLVVAPTSTIAVEIGPLGEAQVTADGGRSHPIPSGSSLIATCDLVPLLFARLHDAPFTDRLVAKFQLPVEGWRGGEPVPPPAVEQP